MCQYTSRLLYIRNGIDVSEEAASIESIMEEGSGGQFITSDDTIDYMYDAWYPDYTDWNSTYEKRPMDEYDYVLRRANAEWKRRIEEAPQSLLDKSVAQELDAYVEKHKK